MFLFRKHKKYLSKLFENHLFIKNDKNYLLKLSFWGSPMYARPIQYARQIRYNIACANIMHNDAEKRRIRVRVRVRIWHLTTRSQILRMGSCLDPGPGCEMPDLEALIYCICRTCIVYMVHIVYAVHILYIVCIECIACIAYIARTLYNVYIAYVVYAVYATCVAYSQHIAYIACIAYITYND